MAWETIPLDAPVLQNVAETALTHGRANAALENAFVNEIGAVCRMPGLVPFAQLGGGGRVTLTDWRGDLIAITSAGQMWRVSATGASTDLTGVPVSGGGRPIVAKTEDELVVAAGGPIVRLAGTRTERLARSAPDSTHVCFVAGYLVAIEPRSGRFYHSAVGDYDSWDPLDVFSAEGKPDDLNAAIVTPYSELLLCGPQSVEQFDPVTSGTQPFYRRWQIGDGVLAPYTLVAANNGVYGVNQRYEFARFAGQYSEDAGPAVGRTLERVDDWTGAWSAELLIEGQKFILLQAPQATTSHDTTGVTLLFDVRQQRWSALYGWDAAVGAPGRWPGWSLLRLWGRWFVGGDGGRIYEMTPTAYDHAGQVQPVLLRTGHWSMKGHRTRVNRSRMRLRRGVVGSTAAEPVLSIRCNRDNRGWSSWRRVGLGVAGDRTLVVNTGAWGAADSWQWEIAATDTAPLELHEFQVDQDKV
ncbi:hypothetical protein F1188_11015 [Roseospira marina]|uniref:Uncharacterized protein n=1 Tax=Roseospira marina TaxID=140057 RepID=A0A5M6ICF7_9PROT|nr:hypothetical protein [Roseospira marina]KAA5605425.1 hypothetical protein F1188_11015 [Roseospira marina]MBB4314581.1 hypothetical protein [Roseospira marina]MBB5088857.1 hypothetical protein [Roseospira marina]